MLLTSVVAEFTTWLTVLLVLAIGASSALVFTNRAELLKLAVILALWAAVVAATASQPSDAW